MYTYYLGMDNTNEYSLDKVWWRKKETQNTVDIYFVVIIIFSAESNQIYTYFQKYENQSKFYL